MTNVKGKRKERGIIYLNEFKQILKEAMKIKDEYERLRCLALLVIFYKIGKRVSEVATIKLKKDVEVGHRVVVITFHLSKKRRKQKREDGTYKSIKLDEEVKKGLSRREVFTHYVVDYYNWMKKHQPDCVYLFPSTQNIFGMTKTFDKKHHLHRSQIYRIIRKVAPKVWLHLFRESRGGKIAERGGRTLETVYRVKEALDLTRVDTAYRYITRYATELIETEEEYEKIETEEAW